MAYMEVSRVEVTEVIRRWQAGGSQRHISAAIGMSRSTVRKYITAAVQAGLRQDGAPPTEEQLTSLVRMNVSGPRTVEIPTEDTLAPWADQVYQWLTAERLQITRIQELLSARGCQVSYTSLRRFLQRRSWRKQNARTVRMAETAPGEVAEMDFGRLGLVGDPATGRRRVAWSLIIVLAHSRHSFVWPLFHQSSPTLSRDWKQPGLSSEASPGTWLSTTSLRRSPGLIPSTPDSPAASWSTLSTMASSPIRHGFATPGTSPTWSVESSTSVSGSSRAGHSQASAISGLKRSDGVLRSLVSESTAQPAGCLWSSSERKSSRPCYPGTGSPTTLPIGARPRYIPTITSPASTPCIRCHRPYACREAR